MENSFRAPNITKSYQIVDLIQGLKEVNNSHEYFALLERLVNELDFHTQHLAVPGAGMNSLWKVWTDQSSTLNLMRQTFGWRPIVAIYNKGLALGLPVEYLKQAVGKIRAELLI